MFLQGGKLFQAPKQLIGRADRTGIVREVKGDLVVATIDPQGNVAGPNKEIIGKVSIFEL